jgi:hypothetical protein
MEKQKRLSSGDIQNEDEMEHNYRKNYTQSEIDFAGQIEFQNFNQFISYFKQKSIILITSETQHNDT